jgi:hypothetical protein
MTEIIFIIWLAISLAIAVYGKISLREFLLYLITCFLLAPGFSGLIYILWNVAIVPLVSLFFPTEISNITFYDTFFAGSIPILFYAITFLVFKTGVRKSDKQKLNEVMKGLKELHSQVEDIELILKDLKQEVTENNYVCRRLSLVKKKIEDLEKLITPWLLKRL